MHTGQVDMARKSPRVRRSGTIPTGMGVISGRNKRWGLKVTSQGAVQDPIPGKITSCFRVLGPAILLATPLQKAGAGAGTAAGSISAGGFSNSLVNHKPHHPCTKPPTTCRGSGAFSLCFCLNCGGTVIAPQSCPAEDTPHTGLNRMSHMFSPPAPQQMVIELEVERFGPCHDQTLRQTCSNVQDVHLLKGWINKHPNIYLLKLVLKLNTHVTSSNTLHSLTQGPNSISEGLLHSNIYFYSPGLCLLKALHTQGNTNLVRNQQPYLFHSILLDHLKSSQSASLTAQASTCFLLTLLFIKINSGIIIFASLFLFNLTSLLSILAISLYIVLVGGCGGCGDGEKTSRFPSLEGFSAMELDGGSPPNPLAADLWWVCWTLKIVCDLLNLTKISLVVGLLEMLLAVYCAKPQEMLRNQYASPKNDFNILAGFPQNQQCVVPARGFKHIFCVGQFLVGFVLGVLRGTFWSRGVAEPHKWELQVQFLKSGIFIH
ncbi:hypothetical protein VP01_2246g3 [Puccinia sorghi]|uniref:Uncharacterized protein n=1 Tax=Puccinia sorghi TaxID=27349 RepID=A0A0L6VAD9_9BASI|nr:hypothetical protein VP01_2246g3 [Puccinia sorghi]